MSVYSIYSIVISFCMRGFTIYCILLSFRMRKITGSYIICIIIEYFSIRSSREISTIRTFNTICILSRFGIAIIPMTNTCIVSTKLCLTNKSIIKSIVHLLFQDYSICIISIRVTIRNKTIFILSSASSFVCTFIRYIPRTFHIYGF